MAYDNPDGHTMTPAELALWEELANRGKLHEAMRKQGEKWTAWFEKKAKAMQR